MHTLQIRKPVEFTDGAEKSRFAKFVESGEEVEAASVLQRFGAAICIVQYMHDGVLAGTSALKTPDKGYWEKCFKNANVVKCQEQFPLELGYVVVEKKLRKFGLGHLLVAAALSARDGNGVYATSELSNLGMHQVLRSRRFEQIGNSYRSKLRNVQLALFVLQGARR